MECIFDLFLAWCEIQTSENDVLYHIRAQCNIEAKCEELKCKCVYFEAFKKTVKASEKEKPLRASIWSKGLFINKNFKPHVY